MTADVSLCVSSSRELWLCGQRPLVQAFGVVLDLAGSGLLCIGAVYDR